MLHRYFIKTPWWIKRIFSAYEWSVPVSEKTLYLTFDDGPHPQITPYVLELLEEYDARASFFCIGNNVRKYPHVFQSVLNAGHSVGNHTCHHINGWTTSAEKYLTDVADASALIKTSLFRPPYGRIRKAQAKGIAAALGVSRARIIMWDVLSADFDKTISKEQCLDNVLRNATPGSIIVFHDSEKAFPHLTYVLSRALKVWSAAGYRFDKL